MTRNIRARAKNESAIGAMRGNAAAKMNVPALVNSIAKKMSLFMAERSKLPRVRSDCSKIFMSDRYEKVSRRAVFQSRGHFPRIAGLVQVGVCSAAFIATVAEADTVSGDSLRVIDGDTVALGDERIRLANIDAPERDGNAECDAERMLAEVASLQLWQILQSGPVTIERTGRDRYGRTLATLSVDGRDVGETLIEGQLAVNWVGRRHDWCD